jgi:hypothetical protein
MSYDFTVEDLLKEITTEDIVKLMSDLGGDDYLIDDDGNLRFRTICHGGHKHKLYYYVESKTFFCYSECGGLSIFDFLMQTYDWDFGQSFGFLMKFKGISNDRFTKRRRGFNVDRNKSSDWEFLNRYKKAIQDRESRKELKNNIDSLLPEYNPYILYNFDKIYPSSWENDYISVETMDRFGISFYTTKWKVIIPHRDIKGRLIGIRTRSFLKEDLKNGQKYMPLYFCKKGYKHPLQFNLYGIYENQESIRRSKKLVLFEGEKSVMQCDTFFPDNNFTASLCGMNMSNYQRDLVLSLGINEVFIALDKQYQNEIANEAEQREYDKYVRRVKKIADRFVNYVNVYIIYDDEELLDYKESPSDKGREVLIELMKKKHKYVGEVEN